MLDAAGWSRAAIARRLEVSERVVKRVLAEHRSVVIATATAAVGGADCARLSATLATYAAGFGRPRLGGPVARHLEICDACRLSLVRARALRALFPPPSAFGIGAGSTPATPLVALKLGAAIVAAVTAAGGLGILAHRPAPANRIAPVVPVVAPVQRATPPRPVTPVQRIVPRIRTVEVTTSPRIERPRVAVARVAPPAVGTPRRAVPVEQPAACDLGTLGICGLGG